MIYRVRNDLRGYSATMAAIQAALDLVADKHVGIEEATLCFKETLAFVNEGEVIRTYPEVKGFIGNYRGHHAMDLYTLFLKKYLFYGLQSLPDGSEIELTLIRGSIIFRSLSRIYVKREMMVGEVVRMYINHFLQNNELDKSPWFCISGTDIGISVEVLFWLSEHPPVAVTIRQI